MALRPAARGNLCARQFRHRSELQRTNSSNSGGTSRLGAGAGTEYVDHGVSAASKDAALPSTR